LHKLVFILFHNAFPKTGQVARFCNELSCGIKYLAQKKPDILSGFSSIAGYQPAPQVYLFLSKTQRPNIMFGFEPIA